jgi:23S rRNA pseudouridine2605 synthase
LPVYAICSRVRAIVADERLQKVLARAGVASRRHAEALISAGRVRVDGRIEKELGVRVSSRARIEVDGRIVVAEPHVYLVLHKPRGVVCTLKDPEGRPSIADYLKDVGARVVPVGRLDFHTSGALLCTNDGELASHLMHPRYHALKEYVAKVGGVVDERSIEKFRERIVIDGRATRPAEVTLLRVEEGKSWLSVKIGEGRNRQVRRLGEHAGMSVMRLARVAHAGITAEDLRPGEWRMLTLDELKALKREYGVPRRIHTPDARLGDMRGGQVTLRQPKARGRHPEKPRPRDDARPWHGERSGPRDDARPGRGERARPGNDARPGHGERARPGNDARAGRGDKGRPRADARPLRTEQQRDDRRPAARARNDAKSVSARGGRGSGHRRGT